MAINDNDIEKVLTGIDNPIDKLKFERLYLLYKLYVNKKTEKITREGIGEAVNRINDKFDKYIKKSSNEYYNKELLNRIIKVNNSYKDHFEKTDVLLSDITYLENELKMVPSFPSYIENVLESQINSYKDSKTRGKR